MAAAAAATLPNLLGSPSAFGVDGATCGKPSAEQPPVVAMFNVAMVGHVNPTFALVKELVHRGCRVHYFLPPSEAIRAAAREAGATVEGYAEGDPADFSLEECGDFSDCVAPEDKFAVWGLASTLAVGEHVLARCRELNVQAAVYDPMTPHALLVARTLGIPCVSLVTFPGIGMMEVIMQESERLERWKKLRRPLVQQIQERYGVDLEGELESRLQWLSEDANLVTTSEALMVPMPPPGAARWSDEVHARFPMAAVGSMASESAPHVTSSAGKKAAAVGACGLTNDFPKAELDAAAERGARIIYAAMGTMAVSDRWDIDISGISGGALPPGTNGKVFCQHLWKALFEAMRELGDGYHCILGIGCKADALDFLEGEDDEQRLAQVPANVTLRTTVQQVVMLSNHAHVFVTHAGFNSLQESLIAGVPMVALPQAADQPANAERIDVSCWGRGFIKPMESATPAALAAALREVAAEDSIQRAAVAAAGADLRGGELRAADVVLRLVSRRDGLAAEAAA